MDPEEWVKKVTEAQVKFQSGESSLEKATAEIVGLNLDMIFGERDEKAHRDPST